MNFGSRQLLLAMLFAAFSSSCMAQVHARIAPMYSVTALGRLSPNGPTHPTGINSAGQVIACAIANDGLYHAALYSDGALSDLGTMGAKEACPSGINDAGQIVGDLWYGDGYTRASFIYTAGVVTRIEEPDHPYITALQVNNHGQVAGYFTRGFEYIGYLWDASGFLEFSATPSAITTTSQHGWRALAINDLGHLALYWDAMGNRVGLSQYFLYSNGKYTNIVCPNPKCALIGISGINGSDQMTGSLNYGPYDSIPRPFIYSDGKLADLGFLDDQWPCSAAGINASGVIVGQCSGLRYYGVGFIYGGGPLVDINTLLSAEDAAHWQIQNAVAINSSGQIAAFGINDSISYEGPVLLTPLDGAKPRSGRVAKR